MSNLSTFLAQVIKVCRTDCIKVQNVKEGVPDDSIKLALMNQKLTKGYVTMVKRSGEGNNAAFVYFADYKGK